MWSPVIPTFSMGQTSPGSFCPDGRKAVRLVRGMCVWLLGSGDVSLDKNVIRRSACPPSAKRDLGLMGRRYRKEYLGFKKALSKRTAPNTVQTQNRSWVNGSMGEWATPGMLVNARQPAAKILRTDSVFLRESCSVFPSYAWDALSLLSCSSDRMMGYHSVNGICCTPSPWSRWETKHEGKYPWLCCSEMTGHILLLKLLSPYFKIVMRLI